MRRAVLTLGGTAAGLAALLSFKTHPVAAAAPPAPAASAAPTQPTASATGSSPRASASGHPAVRTVTGPVASTQYGPMQVAVTVDGGRITKVTVLQRTDDGAESDEIDATAVPQLTSETLAAQSARIDAVSGATYTSAGYIRSLQSALDKAGA